MKAKRVLAVLVVLCLAPMAVTVGAEQRPSTAILDMDTIRHRPTRFGKDKTPAGTVAVVDGKFSKACRFTFAAGARSGFFVAGVKGSDRWNRAAGISFWVKGDGSGSWGGMELIDGKDYALRYAYCFPIDSTEWRKVTVPWRDLLPEHYKAKPVDAKTGYAPAGFRNLWFGKWWYWRDYPAHSFTIDHVALEPKIPLDTSDYTPATGGAGKLRARLRARRPITIVTMGDSLSDKRHWANRKVLWSELLTARLEKTHRCKVRLINAAIGGTELPGNLVLMPRWLKAAPQPDLVTVWFGYNDWSAGARGEAFKAALVRAVDRIRRMTAGRSEVLLMTTCPAVGRWQTMGELAAAARAVAAEKRAALADVAAAFHKAGADPAARKRLFCRDQVHLGPDGHRLVAETVLRAIGAETPSPGPANGG